MKDKRLRLQSVILYIPLLIGFVFLTKQAILNSNYVTAFICIFVFAILLIFTLRYITDILSGKICPKFMDSYTRTLSSLFESKDLKNSFTKSFNQCLLNNKDKLYYTFDYWQLFCNFHRDFVIRNRLPLPDDKFYVKMVSEFIISNKEMKLLK